ncbi:hypothetical protein ACFLSQ_07015 [Bacteroidota bacterium]
MRFLITIIVIFTISIHLYAQEETPSPLGSAYEGKHFYIGFMQNEIMDFDKLLLEILIVSNYPADIIVRIPGENERLYSIKSDSIVKIDIDPALEITEVESIIKKSVEIISTVPILIYAFNSQETTSDCFTAVPVSQWGYEYVVMSYPNDQYIATFDYYGRIDSVLLIPRKSEFLLIASEDETRVEVIPKSITQSLRPKDIPFNVTLNKGDCYLVQSYDFPISYGDLTGTIIQSDKPVGVISGHMRTAVPHFMSFDYESKDHIAAMLTPTSAWGRQFYSVPFEMHEGGDLFRITNIYPNTVVTLETLDTMIVVGLDEPGSFASLPGINQPVKWTSNYQVQIGQYMMHIGGDSDTTNYDPCLVILPPAEQFVSKMIFQTVGKEPDNPDQYSTFEVYLIADFESLNTLRLDAVLVMNLDHNIWNQGFPNSTHRWTRLPVSEGKHHISCESGSFSGIAYGFGKHDSYALTLGSSLSNPYVNDTISPEITIEENCGRISGTITEIADSNSSGLLFAVMSDKSYNYSFNLNPAIMDSTYSTTFTARPVDYMKPGRFVLEYRDKNGNGKSYTYQYFGVGLEVPGTISFGVVSKGDTICYDYSLVSDGYLPVILDSVKVSGSNDDRFEFIQKTSTPVFLDNGDRYEFRICFHPDTSFSKLNQKLLFYFDCGRYDSTIILGSVLFPDLTVLGYDFGDVCLGDTAFGEILIINNGNVPVLIDSLKELKRDGQFPVDLMIDDTTSILPLIIRSGDTVRLQVKYIPHNTVAADAILFAKNDLDIFNEIYLTGRGIAPLINSIEVDWGKRRIGSENDTIIYLHNIGDCDAEISFDGLDGNIIPFMTDSLSVVRDTVLMKDSLSLFASFKPDLFNKLQLKSFFKVNSPHHDQVIVDLEGEGTLPGITTIDVEFDTLDIYSSCDTFATILLSTGNERLWIDYKSMLGDDSSFTINGGDYSIWENVYLEPDSVLTIPITFHPGKLGEHELALIITHDAFPAFRKGDTVVYLRGYARKVDTLTPVISFDNNYKFIPCKNDVFPVYFSNNGNVTLSLDTLELLTENLIAGWKDSIYLPIIIEPDTTIELKLNITPRADVHGKLQIYAVFNDSIRTLSEELEIQNEIYPITIDNPGNLEYFIGDTVSLVLSGSFPHGSELPVGFELVIYLEHKRMHLLENEAMLKVSNPNLIYDFPVTLSQYNESIHGSTINKINVPDSGNWSIPLRFLILLSDSRTTELKAVVNSDLCYSPGEIILYPFFKGVCAFDLRQIKLSEDYEPEVTIAPNPALEELCIKINLYYDDSINLSIYDQYGKKNTLSENLNLKKGSHSLIFELSPMASGVYILSVRTKMSLKNKMFIITK